MNIQIKTKVKGNYKEIMTRFDRQLFEFLLPKQAKTEIVAFTGSKKGDRVHLRFLSPLKMDWVSEIIEDGENASEAWFIDEGVQLPGPLKYWKHKHIVQKQTENSSLIIDDITYKGPFWLFTLFLYPAIYLGFAPRKKQYQAYFGKA